MATITGKNRPQQAAPPPPPPPPPSPEQQASRLAREQAKEEARLKNATLRASSQGRDRTGARVADERPRGRRPVGAFRRRRPTVDQSIILDSAGQAAGDPGKVKRWCRMRDDANRQNSARTADFINFGYEPILDPHTQQPIVSHLGMAMQAEPEAYAERVLAYMPDGAMERDDLLEAAQIGVQNFNRRAGGNYADLVIERDHGSYREARDADDLEDAGGFREDEDED
jgi:hypothetical protein